MSDQRAMPVPPARDRGEPSRGVTRSQVRLVLVLLGLCILVPVLWIVGVNVGYYCTAPDFGSYVQQRRVSEATLAQRLPAATPLASISVWHMGTDPFAAPCATESVAPALAASTRDYSYGYRVEDHERDTRASSPARAPRLLRYQDLDGRALVVTGPLACRPLRAS